MESKHGNQPDKNANTRYSVRCRIVAAALAVAGALPVVAGCGEAIAGQPQAVTLRETPSPTTTPVTMPFGEPPQLLYPTLCSPNYITLYRQSIKNVLPQDIECTSFPNTTLGNADLTITESAVSSDDHTKPHLYDLSISVVRNNAPTPTGASPYETALQTDGAKDETIISPTGRTYNHCFEHMVLPLDNNLENPTSYYMVCLVGHAPPDQNAVVVVQGMSHMINDEEAQADVRSAMFLLAEEGLTNVSR